ncbi:MAG: Mur ligase domain-containing protein, partial [Nitrosomonas sp.]|nr:Mur ligase domain-containing protein [Nitrosomonas sp.]
MMMIQEAARALHTDWGDKDVFFTGVSTDSRTIRQGDLFVALSGDNFDGNQFVSSAAEKGAVAAMIGQRANNNIFTEL